jgi:NADPH:quinone reductase-like Zn-dependent oxidoreductase
LSQTVTMRAVRMHGKGGPEVLQLDRVPIPVAGAGQVRIRILAAGVNPIDWAIRDGCTPAWLTGDPTALRIPGFDAAGVIDQIGSDVSGWKTGDAVIAALQSAPQGAYAEYAVVPAEDVAAKPASMSFDEAAGLRTWSIAYEYRASVSA